MLKNISISALCHLSKDKSFTNKLLAMSVAGAMFVALGAGGQAKAEPVLISQQPWGLDQDVQNMNDVFGAGNYAFYSSFASATPGSVFTSANSFVMIEGGDGSDSAFQSYLSTNSSTILSWVSAGGHLLLQSAGWDIGTYGIGPDSLIMDNINYSGCGTLTPAGQAAFPTTPTNQCGNYLAHDYVTGTGTIFMTGNAGLPIIEGLGYGAGYIMYSGLTDSEFHSAGNSLVDNEIAYTASVAVPEPMSIALFVVGLAGLGTTRRRRRTS